MLIVFLFFFLLRNLQVRHKWIDFDRVLEPCNFFVRLGLENGIKILTGKRVGYFYSFKNRFIRRNKILHTFEITERNFAFLRNLIRSKVDV